MVRRRAVTMVMTRTTRAAMMAGDSDSAATAMATAMTRATMAMAGKDGVDSCYLVQ